MNTYYLCIALLGSLPLLLGFLVSLVRGKSKVAISHSTDPENALHKCVRAHANTTEYVPILMVLIYLLSLSPTAAWVNWFVMLVTASRFIFVAGILLPKTMAKPNPIRFVGALGTYVFGLGLCFALFQQAFMI